MATQQAELKELLTDLVAFQTVSGDGDAAGSCLDFVEDYLESRGMHLARYESNGFPSLVATSQQTKHPKIMLQAHLDVVPCSKALYDLNETEGKLIGRGVFDMKFAAAVFLKLVDELKPKLPDYNFGIMLTFDEEIGGRDGVGTLLDLGYGAKVCILPDAGDNWQLEITQKGVWIAQVKTKGVAVHGSRPWEGDNAIDRLIAALEEIRELFTHQSAASDTLSINQISGGNAVNQVADSAEATLDIRFMNTAAHRQLSAKIDKVLTKHQASLKSIACIQPVETELSHPLVSSFIKIAGQINGSPIKHINSLGNSDAHYFAERDIPVILMRPNGGSAHSDKEWLDKASFEKFYELIRTYIEAEAKS